jgi:hypothetical protein
MSYLRNPLAWRKRYIDRVYDLPSSPASIIGRAGHVALEHFYSGNFSKEAVVDLGLEYLKNFPDFEINFGKIKTRAGKKKKRLSMESEYSRVIGYYLARPPRHKVLGIEVKALAGVPGVPLPIKAISDLVVESRVDTNAVDIIDHKFVSAFSAFGKNNPLFIMQAMFNYYTVLSEFGKPVRRFVVYECKKSKNKDARSQMRRYFIDFNECEEYFTLFSRLLSEASEEIRHRKTYLPNPSDMFDGENSFEIYRQGLSM